MKKMLVLNNAFLIDGKGGDPQPGVSVVVADGIIKEVHVSPSQAVDKNAMLVELE